MTPAELLRNEAAKWLRQAAKDRNAAHALLEVEPSRSVFHSQQAAEKAAKAFLTFHQIAFRKTHDLTDLGAQCAAADPSLEPLLREVEDLTDYASAFRYPDQPYEPDAAEAAEALLIAARLCEEVQRRIVSAQDS
jgi:HEPN domain-containing protein